ncbi:sialidase family protein [Elongatibacter sediminis]|uniref:exo-alpha-sialidase n=1 Tax=Elongatibacter sediminis TaxID=3119006 RepID=A0AAW9RBB5_9GAMM
MRQFRIITFACAVVLTLTVQPRPFGMVTVVMAQGFSGDLSRVSAASPFSADCNGPDFPITAAYVNAESEPYIAVNPRDPDNLIAVYHVDRYHNDGANGALAATSFDGGQTWHIPELRDQPQFSRCAGGNETNGGNFEKASDPWVDFGPDGTAYFAVASWDASNPDNTAQMVSTSTTGGRTWDRPVAAIRANDPEVSNGSRAAVTADPKRDRTAYLVWAWQRFTPQNKAGGASAFSRTTDGGKTWSEARHIYETPPGLQTSANQIVVTPNGDLVNVFNELKMGAGSDHPRHDRIAAIRSTDGGLTWTESTTLAKSFVAGVTDPNTGTRVRVGDSFTDIAVDPRPGTNNIYAVWGDARFNESRTQQIAFAKSVDGGRSWSEPVAVSTDSGEQTFIPSVAVNDKGEVAVSYYGFSARKSGSRALMTHYWITRSLDQGRNWTPRQQMTREPFDLRTAPYNSGFFFGEYQGLAGAGPSFVAVATFTNGRSLDNRTDIFFCSLIPDKPETGLLTGSAAGASTPTDEAARLCR